MVVNCKKQRKKIPKPLIFCLCYCYFESYGKVDMFQISLMGDTEVCGPKE